MKITYSLNGAKRSMTGHYRVPGTRNTYCGKRVSGPWPTKRAPWDICQTCAKAEARDRAEATATATAHLDPATAGTLPPMVCISHGTECDGNPRRRHIFRPAPTPADRAAAAHEARLAAELVTEAEANDGTWRGQWIGDTTALFDRPVEQGALFA